MQNKRNLVRKKNYSEGNGRERWKEMKNDELGDKKRCKKKKEKGRKEEYTDGRKCKRKKKDTIQYRRKEKEKRKFEENVEERGKG